MHNNVCMMLLGALSVEYPDFFPLADSGQTIVDLHCEADQFEERSRRIELLACRSLNHLADRGDIPHHFKLNGCQNVSVVLRAHGDGPPSWGDNDDEDCGQNVVLIRL